MRYMMLIYERPVDVEQRADPEGAPYLAAWRAYNEALLKADAFVTGAPLKSAATATTVRLKEGRRHVQDGPFAEAKEELGGFMILELPSLDAALDWAARCPAAAKGALEIRPIDVDYDAAVSRP
ncbi:MAG TPA: YciI family protein [Planctomycetota bacterium]|nr:YciI family protein [Planctomycetota bacterium]